MSKGMSIGFGQVPLTLPCAKGLFTVAGPSARFTGTTTGGALAITTTSLPGATVGSTYGTTLVATGGTAPYTWTKTADTTTCIWPVVNSAGAISGWPLAAESQTISVQVTDAASNIATATFTIVTASRTGFVPNITSTTLKTIAAGGSATAAYSALNVGTMAVGTAFSDPVTGVRTVKVSDPTHPVSNTTMCNEYSTMGMQISQAWGASLNQYTCFILNPAAGTGFLFDYTLGGTSTNYRAAPAGEGDISFSRLPGEAQILYYTTSTKLNRYNTATSALANTASFPYTWTTIGGSGANWLQFNRKHTWATGLSSSAGTSNFTAVKIGTDHGVTDGHTQNAATGVNSNEGYSGYNDIGFAEGSGNSDWVWDLNANSLTNVTYSAGLSTQFHSPTMPGYWPWMETNQGGGVEPFHQITEAAVFSTPHQGSWYYGSMHTSGHWTQSIAATAQWGLMSVFLKGNPPSNTANLDFNIAFVDFLSGNTLILGGAYSFGTNPDYRAQTHATISDDGLLVMFSSDMFNAGGRTDAFLMEVPKH